MLANHDRLGFTLMVAFALHAVVILGVGFSPEPESASASRLEVTLATTQSKTADEDADFLAQANQQGAGSLENKALIATTEDSPMQDDEVQEAKPVRIERQVFTEFELRVLSSQAESSEQINTVEPEEAKDLNRLGQDDRTEISEEMASLRARLERNKQELAKRGRVRRLTTLSTKRASDAAYLHHWREKVERVGNRHYPKQAREQKMEGELRLLVAIHADGSIKEVKILKSSGQRVLDSAARRIVHLAAPYPPFTGELSEQVDVLEIIRTWKFEQQSLSARY